jgi:uncharacterized membrane protein
VSVGLLAALPLSLNVMVKPLSDHPGTAAVLLLLLLLLLLLTERGAFPYRIGHIYKQRIKAYPRSRTLELRPLTIFSKPEP